MHIGMHALMHLIFSNDINTTFTISYVFIKHKQCCYYYYCIQNGTV